MSDRYPLCQGTDPQPARVAFALPPGTFDSHAHIVGADGTWPYSPGRGYTPPQASLERYLALHEALGGIEHAVAKHTRGRLVERLAGQPGCHRVVRETTIAASACVDGPTATRALELLVMISSPPDTGTVWRNEGLL